MAFIYNPPTCHSDDLLRLRASLKGLKSQRARSRCTLRSCKNAQACRGSLQAATEVRAKNLPHIFSGVGFNSDTPTRCSVSKCPGLRTEPLITKSLLTVRPACREDLEALVEIEILTQGYWTEPELKAELALEYSILLVAEMKTEGSRTVAGLVLVWCLADEVQVIELAVHPDYRRQGIGLALMSEALALGTRAVKKSAGRGAAILEVRKDNEAAVSLYRKLGFRICGTRRRYYPDGGDAYNMRMRI